MGKTYTYPRVSMSTTALKRSSVGPAVEDTTVLFAPIMAKRGPADRIVVCHSLSEFIDTFGDLNYEENGLQAFNVYNWLSNGGTVYAKRLLVDNATKAYSGTASAKNFIAKYPGEWYNNLVIDVTARRGLDGYYDVTVKRTEGSKEVVLENFYRVKGDAFTAALAGSQYFEVGDATTLLNASTYTLTGASNGAGDAETLDELVEAYFKGEAANDLGNALETPIDLILDAGFSSSTKKAIADFVVGTLSSGMVGPNADEASEYSAKRSDIIAIFDKYGYSRETGELIENEGTSVTSINSTNIAIYDQWFVVYDAIFSDMDVKVCPSYFLSKLIPFNDLQYGIQMPTAGLRRGVLEDAIAVNENPRPSEKEQLFKDRINYVEKTSREYAFMSQRTHDGSSEVEYTALSFLHNSRCLEKMKKELERLGREYLFEFNDSVTIAQLSNVLNKYIGGWVSNRTLSYGVVQVASDPYSSEKVNVTLNVKFTGTIEVISVDIIIE